MSTLREKNILTLMSSDDEEFLVEEWIAVQCLTIKNMVEDGCASTTIPLPNVTSATLLKLIEFLKKHAGLTVADDDTDDSNDSDPDPDSDDDDDVDLEKFDSEFVDRAEVNELFDLMLAADYLNIPNLLDLTCQKVADDIKDMSVEEVRMIFDIDNDYTLEQEEELRRMNAWAFE